jgi:FKBP-type peptidyl-prolyl cis-trans isomerase (trigger factor)
MDNQKICSDIKITKKEKNEVEIEGEINAKVLTSYREIAINNFKEEAELPGFRKGKAPAEVVANKIGSIKITEEVINMAIRDGYEEIIKDNNFDVIGQPQITITKFVENGPLNFRVQITILPDFKLSDYKKSAAKEVAKKEKEAEITIEEVDQSIDYLRKLKSQSKDGKDEKLVDLNDEFAKSLGVKDLIDLKEKIKNNLSLEKNSQIQTQKRIKIMEGIIAETTISLPEVLVENELERIKEQFEEELKQAGTDLKKYLEQSKKTEETLNNEWKTVAEKRLKSQLIINKIAAIEKIKPTKEKVDAEIDIISKRYPEINHDHARNYIETNMTNELVFKFLESQE